MNYCCWSTFHHVNSLSPLCYSYPPLPQLLSVTYTSLCPTYCASPQQYVSLDENRINSTDALAQAATASPVTLPDVELSGGINNAATNLQACIGECDHNGQCAVGLKCYRRSGHEAIPGCKGTGTKGRYYCFRPRSTNGTTALVLLGNNPVCAGSIGGGDGGGNLLSSGADARWALTCRTRCAPDCSSVHWIQLGIVHPEREDTTFGVFGKTPLVWNPLQPSNTYGDAVAKGYCVAGCNISACNFGGGSCLLY